MMRVADPDVRAAVHSRPEPPGGRRVRPIPWLWIIGAVLLAVLACGDARAQSTQARTPGESEDLNLVFEREVFTYVAAGRRDPFLPLVGDLGVRPRFDQVTLTGIIQSPNPRESMAVLTDRTGRVYRARAGQVVGDARVIEVSSNRVVFAVSNFGVVRQEVLELPAPGQRALAAAAVDEMDADEESLEEEPEEAADAAGDIP